MSVFVCFFAFFGAKIRPAAAGTGELGWDLRDQTLATKLNAQVIIKNLQNMHEKSLPPTGARRRMELEYQDWARRCLMMTWALSLVAIIAMSDRTLLTSHETLKGVGF